jgi:hypothetical protein
MADASLFPIVTSGGLSEPRLREHVTLRLEGALGRIGGRIERVTTRCSDVNGRRGGVDQACRIELVLRGLPLIVVEKRGEACRQAFDRAARAAKRALRRVHECSGEAAGRAWRRARAPTRPLERPAAAPAAAGSVICRRVGRSAQRLRVVAERPEKRRRDGWVDTAQPGTSESDRKVGTGSTARRNTKLGLHGMTSLLEDSAQGHPSRKSTRRSANRAKRDDNLRLRTTERARKHRGRRPTSR